MKPDVHNDLVEALGHCSLQNCEECRERLVTCIEALEPVEVLDEGKRVVDIGGLLLLRD